MLRGITTSNMNSSTVSLVVKKPHLWVVKNLLFAGLRSKCAIGMVNFGSGVFGSSDPLGNGGVSICLIKISSGEDMVLGKDLETI